VKGVGHLHVLGVVIRVCILLTFLRSIAVLIFGILLRVLLLPCPVNTHNTVTRRFKKRAPHFFSQAWRVVGTLACKRVKFIRTKDGAAKGGEAVSAYFLKVFFAFELLAGLHTA
jgi:hypothetical protein